LTPPTGSRPPRRGPRGHYRYPTNRVPSHTSSKSRQRTGHASAHCHPAREGSSATTCSAAPDPTTQHGRARVLPRVPQLQRAPVQSCIPRLRTPPHHAGGLWCSHVPMTLSGLWAMRINNNNPGHAVRAARYRGKYTCHQCNPSSWARKTRGRRHIKCLQDLWTDGYRVVYQ
jgi:hypothetical protein